MSRRIGPYWPTMLTGLVLVALFGPGASDDAKVLVGAMMLLGGLVATAIKERSAFAPVLSGDADGGKWVYLDEQELADLKTVGIEVIDGDRGSEIELRQRDFGRPVPRPSKPRPGRREP